MILEVEERLRAFLGRELGACDVVRFCGWDHAESNVWEVLADEKRYYLKQHKQPRKFQQEVYAYQNWTLHLTGVPKLVAIHKGPHALLLSAVPGVLAQEVETGEVREREVYRRAGAFLRQLHDLPFEDTDPLPLADALLKRSEAWTKRGEGVLGLRTVDWVRGQLEEAVNIIRQRGWTRVPCHRDYTARNWLLDGDDVYVIDFEHAKPDLFLSDFEKLFSEVWLRRPDLQEVFFEGYGRSLTNEEAGILKRLAAHGAFITVVWAREHRDAAFEQQGREVLERLRGGLGPT